MSLAYIAQTDSGSTHYFESHSEQSSDSEVWGEAIHKTLGTGKSKRLPLKTILEQKTAASNACSTVPGVDMSSLGAQA